MKRNTIMSLSLSTFESKEGSQLVCTYWTGYRDNCGNGVEVVFVVVDDGTWWCEGSPALALSTVYRNWQGNMFPACSSMRDLLIILSAWSVRQSLILPFIQNVAAAQAKWWGTERLQADRQAVVMAQVGYRLFDYAEQLLQRCTTHFACCLNQSKHLV